MTGGVPNRPHSLLHPGLPPADAFTVQRGVPTTMSGLDVLNGYMIVNVTLQMIRPAEFIELNFTQATQASDRPRARLRTAIRLTPGGASLQLAGMQIHCHIARAHDG